MSSNLVRGSQASIDESAIEEGKIKFAIDSARLFIDSGSERIEITDIVYGLKYSEIKELSSPLMKIYLSSDTRQLLVYNFQLGEWESFGNGGGSGGNATCDALGQRIDTTYIKEVKFNDDKNLVLVKGDDTEDIVINPLVEVISSYEDKIKALETEISNINKKIDLINASYLSVSDSKDAKTGKYVAEFNWEDSSTTEV